MFGQQDIILLGAEEIGGEVVGGKKRGEVMPHERPVADEGRGVLAIFPRLLDDEFGRRRPFDMAVQFGFQDHEAFL